MAISLQLPIYITLSTEFAQLFACVCECVCFFMSVSLREREIMFAKISSTVTGTGAPPPVEMAAVTMWDSGADSRNCINILSFYSFRKK